MGILNSYFSHCLRKPSIPCLRCCSQKLVKLNGRLPLLCFSNYFPMFWKGCNSYSQWGLNPAQTWWTQSDRHLNQFFRRNSMPGLHKRNPWLEWWLWSRMKYVNISYPLINEFKSYDLLLLELFRVRARGCLQRIHVYLCCLLNDPLGVKTFQKQMHFSIYQYLYSLLRDSSATFWRSFSNSGNKLDTLKWTPNVRARVMPITTPPFLRSLSNALQWDHRWFVWAIIPTRVHLKCSISTSRGGESLLIGGTVRANVGNSSLSESFSSMHTCWEGSKWIIYKFKFIFGVHSGLKVRKRVEFPIGLYCFELWPGSLRYAPKQETSFGPSSSFYSG